MLILVLLHIILRLRRTVRLHVPGEGFDLTQELGEMAYGPLDGGQERGRADGVGTRLEYDYRLFHMT